jgi:glycosyltransferase involved in cell wall biosynthesis
MTISILIPVNNYDIFAFVRSFRDAFDSIPELIEVLIGDDGSSEEYSNKYKMLEDNRIKVIRSAKNIGRAAIRNKLIDASKGEYLIFVDQDVMLPGTADEYIKKWVAEIDGSSVVFGGVRYREVSPTDPDKILRWEYGIKHEQKTAAERSKNPYRFFSTFNVLFKRSVFEKLRFNEELKQYGYEDKLLAYQLKKAGIQIKHIDNDLYHEGLEGNQEYLDKTKLGIENLSKLFDTVTDKKVFAENVQLIATYNRLWKLGLNYPLRILYNRYGERMELRLNKPNPIIWLFKLYKISMFCMFRFLEKKGKKSIN